MQRLPVLSASVNGLWRTKMFRNLTSVIIVAIAVTFIATRFMKAGSAHLDGSSNTTAQGGCCANQPNSLRRMIGSFYNTEDNFVSTLTLNNKGPNIIAVTPVLHGKNGQTFTAAQVLVNGESSVNVDLNAIANSVGASFKSGSFEFTYQGRMMEMGGGLRIVNAANSLIFDEQMLEPGMKFSSPQLEAVYAIPSDKAEVSVIVTNTTAQSLTVNGDATFVGANGHHPINGTLSPNETSVVKLPPGLVQQSSTGAVSITHNGAKGALLAMIHVWDKDKGFSSAVNFADPAQGKTTQLHGTGLRLGSINNSILKPVIAVRNIGTVATTVTARVPYAKQNGSTAIITLPQTSLAAGETKLLNTTNPGLGQTDIATAGVEINYTSAPGSVIATIHSASLDGNQVFTVPMKDPQGGMSSTGGYPWFIDGSSSTVVFIKNTTNEAQQFHLDVVYPGGRWGSNLQTLAASQTMSFDVRQLRDSQVKGSEGNTIPADANSGHVAWTLRGKRDKVLIGRAQTVDLVKGLTSTYECQCTCGGGYFSSRMTPGSASGFPGDVTQFTAQEQDATCHGVPMSWYNVPSAGVNFSSDNSNVATINFDGNATAVAPGTTNLRSSWETAGVWYYDPYEGGCLLQPYTADCSASCDVNPTVTFGSLTAVGKNYTADVTVTLEPSASNTVINLNLSTTSGTGVAKFSDDTTSKSISQTTTITVKGITESSTSNNIRLESSSGNSSLATLNFTVVEVTLSLRTSGTISADNAAKNSYQQVLGTSNLGTLFGTDSQWSTGVEIVGQVKPSNFTGTIELVRFRNASKYYQGSTLTSEEGLIDDTSPLDFLDQDPQSGNSGGKIYDLDAPGFTITNPGPVGTIYRRRSNFREVAIIGYSRVSVDLNWYTRISIIKTSSGFDLSSGVTGDNQAGIGATALTWNLQ